MPELVAKDWPALRFVFPHAPVRPVTINNGMSMRAWYDIAAFDLNARQDEAGMRASIDEVERLIAREHERGVPSERIVLAGFSQGGAIALAAGLRHPQKLAGIVALSTYLPMADKLAAERSAANAATPIFFGHGSVRPGGGDPARHRCARPAAIAGLPGGMAYLSDGSRRVRRGNRRPA